MLKLQGETGHKKPRGALSYISVKACAWACACHVLRKTTLATDVIGVIISTLMQSVRSSLVYSGEYQKAYCLDSQCASQRGPFNQDFILLQVTMQKTHSNLSTLVHTFFFFSSDSLSSPASAPHKWCVTFSSD